MTAQESAESPTFHLCEASIAEVAVRQSGERFLVTVHLTEVGTEHWAAFTTEHVARQVRVNVGSVLLIEAQVRTPITSGLIDVTRSDRVSAEDVREIIEGAPKAPCGADASDEFLG